MKFKVFSALNLIRCESKEGFGHKINSWSTSEWMTAILGELGEAASIVKKLNRARDGVRGNKETEEELLRKLQDQLGDTFVYLDLLCTSLGFCVGDAAAKVFNRKSQELGFRIKMEE